MGDWNSLEKRLGTAFRDQELLQQALVHRSYINEVPEAGLESNERMEFLGDAVLGMVVAGKLYRDYPDRAEGQLTELRAALVRRETLARVARQLSLGEFLFLGKGEESAGGRARPSNLAAAYEAVVGAVYIDGGIDKARRFVVRSLAAEFQTLPRGRIPSDPKSRLQEILQSRYQRPPSYRVLRDEGPDHLKVFTVQVTAGRKVLGVGKGKSKQMAEKDAARQALSNLEKKGGSAPASP